LDTPIHPLIDGVITIVLVIGSEVVFVLVNVGIFPDPELDESPINVFELVQLKTKPLEVVGLVGVPERTISGTVPPTQNDTFDIILEIVGFVYVNKILESIPSTIIFPEFKPHGSVISISVDEKYRILAVGIVIEPNCMTEVEVNPEPVILTIVPAWPDVGFTPAIDKIDKQLFLLFVPWLPLVLANETFESNNKVVNKNRVFWYKFLIICNNNSILHVELILQNYKKYVNNFIL